MNPVDVLSLFGVMLLLALVPSASVVLVITRSAFFGVKNGVAVAFGIVLGDLIFIALAYWGLSIIAETMGGLFLSIRYIGAAYLIWLGYSLFSSSTKATVYTIDKQNKGNVFLSFFSGLFLTLGDIKAIVFYMSLLPIYIDLTQMNFLDLFKIMLITIISVGGVKVFYAYSAHKIIQLSEGFKYEHILKKLTGGLLVGAGGYLIVKT